jgi:hypothetical protein
MTKEVRFPISFIFQFKNIPGIIYEVYDDQNNFKWFLSQFKTHGDSTVNPFETYAYAQLRYYSLTPN